MRLLRQIFSVLFAIAAVLAGFLVAVVAALLALVFIPLKRPVRVTVPNRNSGRGVIDIDATEVGTEPAKQLER